ncbi:D-alanyl-D-alanine carboxypeptidase [Actinacidiphila sp. DG2A-62]|uniref:D-alanyl-D-alanine carboxypeptidase n=1 Tax=Actinacidiphila sp. DG2A-62 TaxID=3108821 RepID=UPI002DB7121F|nr:D-alanyl-D-alanine carboxypeptidase [Actinacidiphila sp. DG2A-62]MEC3994685.1 D-alanyl-D-alanine carboxypeptidase [Actinacidiphila sp. DG2A-62]
MAGDSPGREKQHETSGEVVDRVAPDPRLVVFGSASVTREATEVRLTSDVRREQAVTVRGVSDPLPVAASAAEPLVEDPADVPDGPADRPGPADGRGESSEVSTPNDVGAVDAETDVATPGNGPKPPANSSGGGKTEPNRDQEEAPEEAPEPAADTADPEPAEGRADAPAAVTEGAPGNLQDAEEDAEGSGADGSDARDAATRTAETGTRTADGQDGTATSDAGPGREAEDAATSDAASVKPSEPERQETPDVAEKPGESGKPEEPGESGRAAAGGEPPARTSVLRPLVSDLPEPRVTYGTPGTPTRAVKGPQTASGAAGAPARPGTPPEPAQAPSKPAGAPEPLPPRSAAKPAAGATGAAAASAGADAEEDEAVGPSGTRSMPAPPLPDKEPLKLLAELTNTPPPPQTFLRSTIRRFKIWTPLVVLLAIVFVLVQALRPLPTAALESTGATSYTFQGAPLPQSMPWPAEGQTAAEVEGLGSLGVHGAQTPVPIASVTKVMTAYVILRDHPLSGKQNGPVITVDKQAAQEAGSEDESTAPVKEGQKFTERQMLQLLLIPSGNNIARLLARWDAGTQEAFVAKMQRTAAGLGMTHTTYTGASGFESTTKSTAVDLLKLERQVMRNDVFRWVVAQPNVTLPGVGRIFNNNNDLVHPGVIGVKTGSSTPAGGALMWAAQKRIGGKEQLILGVTLQQHGGTTVNDSLQTALDRSLALMQSVQNGLTTATIVKKGEVVGHVSDGLGGSTPVVAAKDLTAIGWPGMRTGLSLDPVASGVPHSAKAGTQVGTLSFGSGPARTSVPVVLQSDLSKPSFGTKLTRLG